MLFTRWKYSFLVRKMEIIRRFMYKRNVANGILNIKKCDFANQITMRSVSLCHFECNAVIIAYF